MKSMAAALLLLLAALPGMRAGEPITIGEAVRIQSKVLGEARTLLISTPANYARSTERYPVLYMTDGNVHLLHTRGTVDFLVRNGLMPDVIIVGIPNTDRVRDLTPTHSDFVRRDGTRGELPTSGGAGKFLDFFEENLFPYVESNYRTMPLRIFAGHSWGGTFALHALVARPGLFNTIIAASPDLTWDGDLPLRATVEFFKDRREFRHNLYLSMGNEEAGDPRPTRFERLCQSLAASKAEGFHWDSRSLPEEEHGSVVLPTHFWALRKVFDGWRVPVDPRTRQFKGGLPELREHYTRLSERLGVPIAPPETSLNQVGYQVLGRNRKAEAVAIFRHGTALYPGSANAHDSLGEALEKAGRLAEALDIYGKAVELARKSADPQLGIYVRNRDRVALAIHDPR